MRSPSPLEGARVVVNDIGVGLDGSASGAARPATSGSGAARPATSGSGAAGPATSGTVSPAQAVVDEITSAGGEAATNGDDIADWAGAQNLIKTAVDTFGGLDVLVNNAGFIRDRMLANTSEEEWDAVIRVHLKGHFAPLRHAAQYWRGRAKAGETVDARVINTSSGGWAAGQRRTGQLLGGQGRHRGAHTGSRRRDGPLRRDGERDRARRPHPDDRKGIRRNDGQSG